MNDIPAQHIQKLSATLDRYYALGLHALEALDRGQDDTALTCIHRMEIVWPEIHEFAGQVMDSRELTDAEGRTKILQKMEKASGLVKRMEMRLRFAQEGVSEQLQVIQAGGSKAMSLPDPEQAREVSIEI